MQVPVPLIQIIQRHVEVPEVHYNGRILGVPVADHFETEEIRLTPRIVEIPEVQY